MAVYEIRWRCRITHESRMEMCVVDDGSEILSDARKMIALRHGREADQILIDTVKLDAALTKTRI